MNNNLAWATGLFEGEGCIGRDSRSPRGASITAQIVMTDPDVLERFASIFGVGAVKKRTFAKGGIKQPYRWSVSGDDAMFVTRAIYPLLCKRRHKLATQLILDRHIWREGREASRACRCGTRFTPVVKASKWGKYARWCSYRCYIYHYNRDKRLAAKAAA